MGNTCSACQDCCGKQNKSGLYEPLLQENEREAIAELLQYLENRSHTNFFEGEPLRPLSTLAYSDNVDLQRSAALAFAEITEKDVRQVGRETLDPILFLLQSHDIEVQRAASAALGNLAVNTENKLLIVKLGGLEQLIRQMGSPNVEVQCNAVGCITNLATHDDNKAKIAKSDALRLLVDLARSKDQRVQRNATGALLNMTHTQENRQQLVNAGAIPVLIGLLSSEDADVQYYCTTALSNIAVDANNRKKLAQSDSRLVQHLIALMDTKSLKVQCQAALALRNLASDEKYQLEIVRCKGLPPLLRLLRSSFLPLILSSVACIRNISIHPTNESPIIDEGFVNPLIELLSYDENEEIQCHAISTLRNLAASSERNKRAIIEAGAVERIKNLINQVPTSVQTEMTAAIAVLALSDELKQRLLGMNVLNVLVPLTSSQNMEVQGNSAAAIGNLSSKVKDYTPFVKVWSEPGGGLHDFLIHFLSESQDIAFQHIGVWTVEQFLEGGDKELISKLSQSSDIVSCIRRIASTTPLPKSKVAYDSTEENVDDMEGDIVGLAKRVMDVIEKDNTDHNQQPQQEKETDRQQDTDKQR
ncbi:putative VAC8-vacuolar membrane protein required for the cytoplasm-to-vacuole targeting [Halteromyces radiatus]|uniref:putative VAC8-vacuolar membrane protein required for the cytoplasm-to-vacuole targeting n=1 Tax=Halteromyces radiatus TaxID=101107 RepID=UPI00221F3FD8|nr:putative VAC8-vacuolar membrane protein required for the cytoplasm-to-vacuole targeting [Halteromyces radiatus]KAI8077787.1 putative VAC8-vacuolar membrane protein required for the cytoplasm-to-vacuole targeting [Halteromyces radiatus]